MALDEIYLGGERRVNVAVLYREIFERIHHFGDPDVLRAALVTRVACRAKPNELGFEHLLLHSEEGHVYDSAGVKAVVGGADRA